jgi:hypothetical protein
MHVLQNQTSATQRVTLINTWKMSGAMQYFMSGDITLSHFLPREFLWQFHQRQSGCFLLYSFTWVSVTWLLAGLTPSVPPHHLSLEGIDVPKTHNTTNNSCARRVNHTKGIVKPCMYDIVPSYLHDATAQVLRMRVTDAFRCAMWYRSQYIASTS